MEYCLTWHRVILTTMAAIVVSFTSTLAKHHKRGNIQWLLFKKIIVFRIIGAFAGALIASFIPGRYLEYIFDISMLLLTPFMLFKNPFTFKRKLSLI